MKEYDHERKPRRKYAPSQPMPERSPENRPLIGYLEHRGLSPMLALENGWYVSESAGDQHTRIVIPCTHSNGRVYWQARFIGTKPEVKRYQSPPYSAEGAFVLVWPEDKPVGVVLVEGPLDALAAAECGYAGVAMMGNRPGANLLQNVVNQFPGKQIVVVPDTDAVRAGAVTVARLALLGVSTRLMFPVGAKDLSRMPLLARRQLLGS